MERPRDVQQGTLALMVLETLDVLDPGPEQAAAPIARFVTVEGEDPK